MTIDWQHITSRYKYLLAELSELKPAAEWHIKPQLVKLTSHKTKYGMADIHGVVHINQAFIETQAFRLLDVTIRHELAHLCVGLQHGHDQHFKAMARLFQADFGRHLKTETDQVHAAIGYKYLLYATLANQQKLLFRRAHRKHAKYLNYKPGRFRYLTIRGEKVQRFEYIKAEQ